MMYSCGQAQISAEVVAESHWLCQIAQKSCRSVHLGDHSPCAIGKPKPALVRISPTVFLHLSTGVGTGLQRQVMRHSRQVPGWGPGVGVSTV